MKKNIADDLLFNELKSDSAEAVIQIGDLVKVYSNGILTSQGNVISNAGLYQIHSTG